MLSLCKAHLSIIEHMYNNGIFVYKIGNNSLLVIVLFNCCNKYIVLSRVESDNLLTANIQCAMLSSQQYLQMEQRAPISAISLLKGKLTVYGYFCVLYQSSLKIFNHIFKYSCKPYKLRINITINEKTKAVFFNLFKILDEEKDDHPMTKVLQQASNNEDICY